ncbi:MAG: efflux RND transporter periplasmic adaptor subunit [Deltaproteobacteria bacterium]|nr:efflux RND transporter periplasmic adaptor subunit [Deltaproteobacteria bacterium]
MRVLIFLKHSLLVTVLSLFLFAPASVQAGCGCDKPPPPPAAVIPHVAFRGMALSIFHDSFKPGQVWQVTFRSNGRNSLLQRIKVEQKRDLGDSTGKTLTSRLTVTLPYGLPIGPASITVSRDVESFTIPASAFTVIGDPVVVSVSKENFRVRDYTTAVGADNTLYLSLTGLDNVCLPMNFRTSMKNNPLRFTYGDIIILNSQGFLIESLDPASQNHFFIEPKNGNKDSDRVFYWRHSFVQYCQDHRHGGPKEVDPRDPNWHLDGTRHVDYASLIFAIIGHYDNQSIPQPGQSVFDLRMETEPKSSRNANHEGWETERDEEANGRR